MTKTANVIIKKSNEVYLKVIEELNKLKNG